MAFPERNAQMRYGSVAPGMSAEIDQGLRSYMLKVYNYMAIGLVVTGVVAFGAFNAAVTTDPANAVGQAGSMMLTSFGAAIYTSPLRWVIMFAPLIAVLFLSFRISSMSVGAAQALFWGYAALVGLSLSSISWSTPASRSRRCFFITAASFGALSLYGYTTGRGPVGPRLVPVHGPDRSDPRLGREHLPGVLGARVRDLGDRRAGVRGLTAYDTQRIKEMYFAGDDYATAGRKAIMGALQLYLDFINMFVMLLQLFGQQRD